MMSDTWAAQFPKLPFAPELQTVCIILYLYLQLGTYVFPYGYLKALLWHLPSRSHFKHDTEFK